MGSLLPLFILFLSQSALALTVHSTISLDTGTSDKDPYGPMMTITLTDISDGPGRELFELMEGAGAAVQKQGTSSKFIKLGSAIGGREPYLSEPSNLVYWATLTLDTRKSQFHQHTETFQPGKYTYSLQVDGEVAKWILALLKKSSSAKVNWAGAQGRFVSCIDPPDGTHCDLIFSAN